jgi:hypothetical protein
MVWISHEIHSTMSFMEKERHMPNLNDWTKDIRQMTDEELQARLNHLEGLRQWPMFEREFKWTMMFALASSISGEIENRDRASLTPAPLDPPETVKVLSMEKRYGADYMVWERCNTQPYRRYYDNHPDAVSMALTLDAPLYKKEGDNWKRCV